jgi:hypothetical protein
MELTFNDAALAYYFLDPQPVFASHQAQNDSIIAHIASPSYVGNKNTQFTQELRATSPKPGAGLPLKWTAGLYYSKTAQQNSENNEFSPGLNSAFQSIYGYPLSSPIVQTHSARRPPPLPVMSYTSNPIRQTVDEYAALERWDMTSCRLCMYRPGCAMNIRRRPTTSISGGVLRA